MICIFLFKEIINFLHLHLLRMPSAKVLESHACGLCLVEVCNFSYLVKKLLNNYQRESIVINYRLCERIALAAWI